MSVKEVFRRISVIMPEVTAPKKRIDLRTKLIWTTIVVVIYLIMTQIPLYGVGTSPTDPFQYSRIIFASNRGTLMELGIGPIVTAGLIMQLLRGSDIIRFDFTNPEERGLFTAATKFLTIVITIVQSAAYLFAGIFGPEFSISTITAIFIQLVIATLIVMMLDELVQKGWGIGSGISLFIAVGVSQEIFWNIFSPLPVQENGYDSFFGIIPHIVNLLASGRSLSESIYRVSPQFPTLIALLATIIVAIVIIYVEGIRVEIPISYARHRGFRGRYPVKLLYVSNIPVILAFALIQNFYIISQIIWSRFNPTNTNWFFNLIGTYNATDMQPTGGFAYFITAPSGFGQAISQPVRALLFIVILTILAVVFATIWVQIGGLSADDVSRQLIDAGMQVPGWRRRRSSISMILGRYIPIMTIIGGIFVGFIAGSTQILGVFGGGIGILLTIDILMQYYQLLMREQIEEIYPSISRVLRV